MFGAGVGPGSAAPSTTSSASIFGQSLPKFVFTTTAAAVTNPLATNFKPSVFGGFGSTIGGFSLDRSQSPTPSPSVESSPTRGAALVQPHTASALQTAPVFDRAAVSNNPWKSAPSTLFPASKFGKSTAANTNEDVPKSLEKLVAVTKPVSIKTQISTTSRSSSEGKSKISPSSSKLKFGATASRLLGSALAKKSGIVKKRLSSATGQNSAKSNVVRSVSPECTTFKIMRLPAEYNNERYIRECLEPYGTIVKITCKRLLNYAAVQFTDHESAAIAKQAVSKEFALGKEEMTTTWVRAMPSNVSPKPSVDKTVKRPAEAAGVFGVIPKHIFNFAAKKTDKTGVKQTLPEFKSSGDETYPESGVSSTNIANQLQQLLGRRANTLYDKYQLLEERDKILRKARVKIVDVDRAEVVAGTCPDMCPEKERYQMQVQKRLTPYEIDDQGNVIDKLIVKDYSRSSADQEAPLAHELRGSAVLQLCMNYLLALPVPNDENQLSVWFDFVWNRSRGIRKEINQQMLKDDFALALVEKCARFHAYAAHRLCEKGAGEFDQKMNTENLSKSLQSLRHFYEDLEKMGLAATNEPEFRAIDIMLSLNDSNVMNQVLAYPDRVRQSAAVVLALKLFLHKQSNNFAAFFRLVRTRTNFLQACVLHRYFDQVRTDALRTMIMGYTRNSQVPISDIVRVLCFDSDEEAIEFCAEHSMSVSDDSATYLVLEKAAFEPPTTLKHRRSKLLVESKLGDINIGEILNGGSLSPVDLHVPHTSFDENGVYCNDPVIIPYLQGKGQIDAKQKQQFTGQNAIIGGYVDQFMNKELVHHLENQARLCMHQEHLVKAVFDSVLPSLIQTEVLNCMQKERNMNEMRKKEAEKGRICNLIDDCSQRNVAALLETTVESSTRELAARTLLTMRNEKRVEEVRKMIDEVAYKAVNSLTSCIVKEECSKQYVERVLYPIKKLARIKKNLHKIWMRKYLQRWRIFAAIKSRKRKVLENFPVSTSYGLSLGGESRKRRLSYSPSEKLKIRRRIQDLGQKLDVQLREGWEWPVIRDFGVDTAKGLAEIRKRLDRAIVRSSFDRWLWLVRAKRQTQAVLRTFGQTSHVEASASVKVHKRKNSLSYSEQMELRNEWSRLGRETDETILQTTLDQSNQFNQTLINESNRSIVAGLNETCAVIIPSDLPDMQANMKKLNSAIKEEKLKMQQDEIRWKELLEC